MPSFLWTNILSCKKGSNQDPLHTSHPVPGGTKVSCFLRPNSQHTHTEPNKVASHCESSHSVNVKNSHLQTSQKLRGSPELKVLHIRSRSSDRETLSLVNNIRNLQLKPYHLPNHSNQALAVHGDSPLHQVAGQSGSRPGGL